MHIETKKISNISIWSSGDGNANLQLELHSQDGSAVGYMIPMSDVTYQDLVQFISEHPDICRNKLVT